MKSTRTVLKINLDNLSYTYSNISGGVKYIGGAALSDYLLLTYLSEVGYIKAPYVSITTGPLSGIYPYTSKSVLKNYSNGGFTDYVCGGRFGSYMNISGISSLEIMGKSKKPILLDIKDKSVTFLQASNSDLNSLGFPGRRTLLSFGKENLNDDYFSFGQTQSNLNNLIGLSFTVSQDYKIIDLDYYKEVYKELVSKMAELQVSKGTNPSCFGCPVGCAFSDRLESANTSVLSRSLVSCAFAEPIYSDINTVFKCFQALKFEYHHEDLESFSFEAGKLRQELHGVIKNVHNS